MSAAAAWALLSLLPAAGLWSASPRRLWPASLSLAVSLVGGAWALWSASAGLRALAAAAATWGALGCGASLWLCWRSGREAALRAGELEGLRSKRREAAESLREVKARGLETEREQKETLVLYGMIKALSEALSWEDIKPKLEAAVGQYLGLSDFALYIVGPRPGEFRALSARRLEGSPGASWATLERFLQERGLTPGHSHLSESPEPALALPIQDSGEILGYFYGRAPQGGHGPALLAKAQGFFQEIGFAFRRIKLFQEMEGLSRIDGLTGVYRRGDFEERLRQETVRAKTFKTTLGLMLLDIDHFKQLNDRYGHQFGDQVLRRVGEILNASVYDTDFVARYGGEEFVVLLPRAEPAGAMRKAESIRRAIEGEGFQLAFDRVPVTVSIGIAHYPHDAATPEELVARADAAMYEAKSSGRNRVVDCRTRRSET